jgi:hypothetical protein
MTGFHGGIEAREIEGRLYIIFTEFNPLSEDDFVLYVHSVFLLPTRAG